MFRTHSAGIPNAVKNSTVKGLFAPMCLELIQRHAWITGPAAGSKEEIF
ncbi:MAG: hypothetical protein JW937_04695 [Candidatus Omnitrophica bacterium]|nr:hypothetical protein [Candidatus Omnitrophota bacterium]